MTPSKRNQARKEGSLGELWGQTSYSQTRATQRQWSPTGQSPLLLHTLRRAEPSEANPTTLLRSFEGYPLRVQLRSEKPCLHAEVSACLPVDRQALRHAGVAFCIGG